MDRREAIEILKEAFAAYESDYRCIDENAKWDNIHEALDMAIEALSADAVQGEWIRVGHDIYECSLCHRNVMTKGIDCYSFCHQCGAKMKGVAE